MIKDIVAKGVRYLTIHLTNGDEITLAVIDTSGKTDWKREASLRDSAIGLIGMLQANYSEARKLLLGREEVQSERKD